VGKFCLFQVSGSNATMVCADFTAKYAKFLMVVFKIKKFAKLNRYKALRTLHYFINQSFVNFAKNLCVLCGKKTQDRKAETFFL